MKPLTSNDRMSASRALHAELDRQRDALLALGFRPAFFDYATCAVHRSRHADGSLAGFHVLDGLPDAVVVVRSDCGRVLAVKATLVAGFERNGWFFTNAAAGRAAREWGRPA